MKQTGIVLSDFHCGSAYGLLPPDFITSENNHILQNKGQEWLWERFIQTLNRIQPLNPDFIVINGDILDGEQRKSRENDLCAHRMCDQREIAYQVLKQVKNRFPNAKMYFTSGTPYHEVRSEVESVVMQLFGEKQEIHNTLRLKIGESLLHFHHEMTGFSSGMLRSNSVERAILEDDKAFVRNGWEQADALIGAHCHYFLEVMLPHKISVVNPCWKLQDAFAMKRQPQRTIPNIGAIVLHIDDERKKYGLCPVSVTPYLYNPPAPKITVLEDKSELVEMVMEAV